MVRSYLERLLSTFAKVSLKRGLKTFRVSKSSTLLYSRIRISTENELIVGENSLIETQIVFEKPGARVKIGNRTFIGGGIITAAKEVEIGDDVLIAWGVSISDHNSHSIRFSERENDVIAWKNGKKDWSHVSMFPVTIGSKAWIGRYSIILKGVNIGEGSIVGAGSVVIKDVPPWTMVGGNPARIIREIPIDER